MNRLALGLRKTLLIALLWIAALCAPSQATIPQSQTDPQNGKRLFDKLGCSRCHGSAGEGMPAAGKEAGTPKIAGTHLSPQSFAQSVRMPKGQMPPFGPKQVTEAELSEVYAFLQSVASQPKIQLPSSASSQNGQHLYTSFGCYECHGYEGQGSVQTGGTRIGPPQIPYSGFVAYARQPTGQMPPYTSKAVSDAQLADIYVFLRSRPGPSPRSIPFLNQ